MQPFPLPLCCVCSSFLLKWGCFIFFFVFNHIPICCFYIFYIWIYVLLKSTREKKTCFLIGIKTLWRYGKKRWRHMKEINWLLKDGVTWENNGSRVGWQLEAEEGRTRKDILPYESASVWCTAINSNDLSPWGPVLAFRNHIEGS